MVADLQSKNVLRLLFWETTAGCNLECIHCRRLDVSKQLMQNDLKTAEAFQFIDDLAEFAQPILVLSGGEPLFRPDIFQIATHGRDRGLPVALAGFRHLKALGMSMQINCTVTKHNVHQIEDLYSKAVQLGADALHLFMLVPLLCEGLPTPHIR